MFIGAELNQILANPVIHEAFHKLRENRQARKKERESLSDSHKK